MNPAGSRLQPPTAGAQPRRVSFAEARTWEHGHQGPTERREEGLRRGCGSRGIVPAIALRDEARRSLWSWQMGRALSSPPFHGPHTASLRQRRLQIVVQQPLEGVSSQTPVPACACNVLVAEANKVNESHESADRSCTADERNAVTYRAFGDCKSTEPVQMSFASLGSKLHGMSRRQSRSGFPESHVSLRSSPGHRRHRDWCRIGPRLELGRGRSGGQQLR